MTTDIHEGPLESAPVVAAPPAKRTRREERWERRRRRARFEEVAGWILVPVILFAVYIFIDGVLAALGTSPSAIMAGLNTILDGL